MDSESPLPAKRLRASLNGNMQLTECIREFKLPRQYPSMVSKLNETSIEKDKSLNFPTTVACIPKASIGLKIIENKDISLTHTIRTIKLKGKDGRDLGEVNIKDLPQNIQGKTITIAKNVIKKAPEIISLTEKTKGITAGVPASVRNLKSDEIVRSQIESKLSSHASIVKTQTERLAEIFREKNVTKNVPLASEGKLSYFESIVKTQTERLAEVFRNKNITKSTSLAEEGKLSAVPIVKTQTEQIAKTNTISTPVVGEEGKITTGINAREKPQVLVFQSGDNWHMVKIPKTLKTEELIAQGTRSIRVEKLPKSLLSGKLSGSHSTNDQQNKNVTAAVSVQNGADSSSSLINKTPSIIRENRTVMKQCSQPGTPDSTTDGCKSKSSISTASGERARPKIEVSRIFGAPGIKSVSSQSRQQVAEISKSVTRSETFGKNPSLGQDVMVVLPTERESDTDVSVISDNQMEDTSSSGLSEKMIESTTLLDATSAAQSSAISSNSVWKKKLLTNKNNDTLKYPSSRDITLAQQTGNKIIDKGEETSKIANISILEKALSTVEDEVLREKALKALAECGIGIERRVPIRPAVEQKSVKDSDTQTSIFGLWEQEKFIHVPENSPVIERIQIIERPTSHGSCHPIGNPNSQELYTNSLEIPNWVDSHCVELSNMVEGYVEGNEVAAQVANIFAKPSPIRLEVVEQLEKDFNTYRQYDENGLLNIHKAVVNDNIRAVQRHLIVLRGCDESADIPTRDGKTSLELAIRYDVSPKIITMLLDAGAEPTSTNTAQDSALIIASRQSLPIIKELITRVKTRIALDNYDSTGFAAVHYCAQNGYHEGIEALIRASADVNLRDRRSGRTALFHAIENEHNDLAQMLLEKGAEASIPNYGGQTIFNVIDESKHFNLLEILNRITAR